MSLLIVLSFFCLSVVLAEESSFSTAPEWLLAMEKGQGNVVAASDNAAAISSSRKRSLTAATEVLWRQIVNPFEVVSGSVACSNFLLGHADNSYIRYFSRAAALRRTVGVAVDVLSVTYGVQDAFAGGTGTTQPIEIRFYSGNAPAGSPLSAYSLRSTTQLAQANSVLQQHTIKPNPTTIPAGDDMVVIELFTPNGQAVGHFFFIGSNPDGGAPSYIQAATCGLPDPATIATVGFPDNNYLLEFTTTAPPVVDLTPVQSAVADNKNQLTAIQEVIGSASDIPSASSKRATPTLATGQTTIFSAVKSAQSSLAADLAAIKTAQEGSNADVQQIKATLATLGKQMDWLTQALYSLHKKHSSSSSS